MLYWITMFLLAAGCVGMLAWSYISVKKRQSSPASSGKRNRRRPEEDYGGEEEYNEPVRRKQRQTAPRREEAAARPRRKKKRQWKIILEDIDSWEKFSFVFYDTVGIGRDRSGKPYEKYLSLEDDKRVSKCHCVIIRSGDRLYLKDEDSRNGTYLNGQRIDQPMELQKDDIIGVGGTRLEVQRVLRESE